MQVLASKTGEFTASLFKALTDIDPQWTSYNGLLLTGSHNPQDLLVPGMMEVLMTKIRSARETGLPTLGLCFGLEMAVVEYARNVLGWPTATSEELEPEALVKVIDKMPGMRSGSKLVIDRYEEHWHQYKVHDGLVPTLAKDFAMIFADDIVEQMQLNNHPFFLLTQYHPEYSSKPWDPHPVLVEFVKACKKHTT